MILTPSRRILTPSASPWWRLPRHLPPLQTCHQCGRPLQRQQQRQQNMANLGTRNGNLAFTNVGGVNTLATCSAPPTPPNCLACQSATDPLTWLVTFSGVGVCSPLPAGVTVAQPFVGGTYCLTFFFGSGTNNCTWQYQSASASLASFQEGSNPPVTGVTIQIGARTAASIATASLIVAMGTTGSNANGQTWFQKGINYSSSTFDCLSTITFNETLTGSCPTDNNWDVPGASAVATPNGC
jgi:hypothetical protein